MPVKSDRQRRAMGAALRGKSTLGIPKKVAKEYLGKADGGKAIPTGSAGVTAPTIATSARGYAEGGMVFGDTPLMKHIKKKDRERLDKQKAAKKKRDAAKRKSQAIADTERAKRAAATSRARQVTRGKLARQATRKPSGVQAAPATRPPSRPAKVTVGRDGSVTTTRRSPVGTSTTKRTPSKPRVRGPTGAARKVAAKVTTPRSGPERRRGPVRKTRTRPARGLLGRAVQRLTEMNKASVKRARAHNARD